jgi:hypothetical protein
MIDQEQIYATWARQAATMAINASWTVWSQSAHDAIRQAQTQAMRNAQAMQNAQLTAPYGFVRRSHEEIEREIQEKARREAEAKARAEKLLLGVLTAEQRAELAERGHFYMRTKNGRRYRIDRHTHGNVYLLNDKGERVQRYCAQPDGVPRDDAIAAQKLALDADEESFLRVANMTVVNEAELLRAGRR